MKKIAIIGGTGLTEFKDFDSTEELIPVTPLGHISSSITRAVIKETEVFFLARHGHPHKVPPHKINYRANLWALKELGVTEVVAVNAVGGITHSMDGGVICVPDQIVDYTWGRESTFFDGVFKPLDHIDFSYPYSEALSEQLVTAAKEASVPVVKGGTYGATQGPRLETVGEIRRLENDGCDLVGMTGMPEASLARELELEYASLCLVVNKAAGKSDGIITMEEINETLSSGMDEVKKIIHRWIQQSV